jgi:uncharacterized phage protein (TIGR01671 family)
MREILFRGRYEVIDYKTRTVSFKWAEGCLDTTNRNYVIFSGVTTRFAVDRETVGQYTGLTDKNGKKIFEGDVIEYFDNWGDVKTSPVLWRGEYYPAFDTEDEIFECANSIVELLDDSEANVKVIGNIHDNPELLGRKAEAE